ncbi:MAG TPA: MFS transporter, partial [Verrucomicrobiae bacterium]
MQKPTRLFTACIIALVAVAFGFVIRAFLLNEWGVIFNLSETQKGSIQGAGLYPQALSIIFFSLIIDKIGYGRVIVFAFLAHVASVILTVTATG